VLTEKEINRKKCLNLWSGILLLRRINGCWQAESKVCRFVRGGEDNRPSARTQTLLALSHLNTTLLGSLMEWNCDCGQGIAWRCSVCVIGYVYFCWQTVKIKLWYIKTLMSTIIEALSGGGSNLFVPITSGNCVIIALHIAAASVFHGPVLAKYRSRATWRGPSFGQC
jgi:hypothetical protein